MLDLLFKIAQDLNPKDILILSPYRAQLDEYAKMLRAAQLLDPFTNLDLSAIKLSTVDGYMGDEEKYAIFDTAICKNRVGGIGFVAERWRLNVAITRAQDCFIIVRDMRLTEEEEAEVEVEGEAEAEAETEKLEGAQFKFLKGVFNHYKTSNCVHPIHPDSIEQIVVDLGPAQAFKENIEAAKLKEQTQICYNCQQAGYTAQKCTNLTVARKCNSCGKEGHMRAECTKAKLRRKCGKEGHKSAVCPTPYPKTTCHNYRQKGHRKQDCVQPKVPTCRSCSERGHTQKD